MCHSFQGILPGGLLWVTQYSLSYRSQFLMLGSKSRRGGQCYTKCFPSNLWPKSTNQRGRPVLNSVLVRSERGQELYSEVQRGPLYSVSEFRDPFPQVEFWLLILSFQAHHLNATIFNPELTSKASQTALKQVCGW